MMSHNEFSREIKKELVSRKYVESTYNLGHPLKDSDVIGFDIDHTLSIYNTKNMCKLLYKSFADFLVDKKHYPSSISFENNSDFVLKASRVDILLDLVNGNALRLDNRKKILKAFHGKEEMSEQRIASIYKNSKYSMLNIGKNNRNQSHFFVKGNFEYNIVPIFLVCVDAFDKGHLRSVAKDYAQIKEHIIEAIIFNYCLPDNFADFQNHGYFFPEIYKHPELYLYKSYSALNMLKKLKDQGKHLFFVTNSFYSYAKFVMQNTVGPDFAEVFDLGFFESRKPNFYYDFTNEDELESLGIKCIFEDGVQLDLLKNRKNMEEPTFLELQEKKFLVGGSFHIIENYYKKLLGKDKIKITFVGDDLFGDCGVPGSLENWNAVFINDSFMKDKYIGEVENGFSSLWNLGYNEAKNFAEITIDYFREVAVALLPNVEFVPLLC